MNKYRLALLGALLWVIFSAGGAMALPLPSGNFSGWLYEGDVSSTSAGEAVLGDNVATYSHLYQGAALAAGNYTIQFNFRNFLSPTPYSADSGGFAFLDTFFTTLYSTSDLTSFSLDPQGAGASKFDAALSLFSLDANGAFGYTGKIGPSQKGNDWNRFSMDFHNDYAYAIPVFELLDLNYINDDSSVLIDNLSITAANPVPEPGTLAMLLGGFAVLIAFRKKFRH